MFVVKFMLAWFLISIIFSLAFASFLALTGTSNQEDLVRPKATGPIEVESEETIPPSIASA